MFLFIETAFSMIFGYIFWVILSRFATPEIVGTSSTVISLSTIFITVVAMGIPNGLQRFLGKSFSERKLENAKVLTNASLLLTTIGIVICCVLILLGNNWFDETFRIDFKLLIVVILLIGTYSITNLFRFVVIASLNTKKLPVIMIASSIVKQVVAVLLVMIGTGALGATIGYAFFPILSSLFLSILVLTIFKSAKGKPEVVFKRSLKDILVASVVSWIPTIIYTVGLHLGQIMVFRTHGANQAGVYFIAFSIAGAISAVMLVLLTITYPALSAMHDGRKRLAWRVTKISLIIAMPLASAIIFSSKEIMQLFGKSYIDGSFSLEILLLSMVPTAVMTGVNTLVYSYGNYRQVLVIGLSSNIPRAALYFILVPIYGGVGAAISFTAGSISGFILSIIIAKQIGMKIFWKDLALILLIPMGFAFILSHFEINYIAVIAITLITSYMLFLRVGIVTRIDVQDSLGVLPSKIANPAIKLLNAIGNKLNRSY